MTIHVRHIHPTQVEVTLTPGRLARLFGGKTRRGLVDRGGYHSEWRWSLSARPVGWRIEREIECTTVEDLPRAEARRG